MNALQSTIEQQTGSGQAVQDNLLSPMLHGGTMTTFDGTTTMNQQGTCQNSAAFLEILAIPSATGDITQLNIRQDKNWDGVFDSLVTNTTIMSGVCANGIISCNPGTWNDCRYYKWEADPTKTPVLTEVVLSDLGGCYCINDSCGQALMIQNAGEVVSHIGGGIVSVLAEQTPTLIVSESYAQDLEMTFIGGLSDRCNQSGQVDQDKYLDDPAGLTAAGRSTSTLNSLFTNLTSGSIAAETATTTHNCSLKRTVGIDEANAADVIAYNGGVGGLSPCGQGCLAMALGEQLINKTGTCGLFKHEVEFWVQKPERIISATLDYAMFDDHIQITTNNHLIWAHDSGWTDIAETSYPSGTQWFGSVPVCERNRIWQETPNTDFTNAIKSVGNHKFKIRFAVADRGGGYASAKILVDETCRLYPDNIENTCAFYESDPDCDLEWESVDGITTLNNYSPTGLIPLGSTRTISGSQCLLPAQREWWHRDRRYKCRTQSQFDFTGAMQRKSAVSDSASSTAFDDLRLNETTGAWESHSGLQLSLPQLPAMGTCEKTCKTQKGIAADEVAGMGAESGMRTSDESIEFNYYTCTQGDICPAGVGETVIVGCGCHDHFMEATLQMQTGRLAGRDILCTSGTPSPL